MSKFLTNACWYSSRLCGTGNSGSANPWTHMRRVWEIEFGRKRAMLLATEILEIGTYSLILDYNMAWVELLKVHGTGWPCTVFLMTPRVPFWWICEIDNNDLRLVCSACHVSLHARGLIYQVCCVCLLLLVGPKVENMLKNVDFWFWICKQSGSRFKSETKIVDCYVIYTQCHWIRVNHKNVEGLRETSQFIVYTLT